MENTRGSLTPNVRNGDEERARQRALRGALLPGERILWQGRPGPGAARAAFLVWLFAVPWTAFALFWIGTALAGSLAAVGENGGGWSWATLAFPLFGVPFVAVGAWMLALPFRAARIARATDYVLTPDRLVSFQTGDETVVRSVDLDRTGPMTVKRRADGSGTLVVETGSHLDCDGDRATDTFRIEGVADVARLERLLLEARNAR